MKAKLLTSILLAIGFCVCAAPLAAKDKLPETTKDGLQLQHNTKLAAVYLKPGETLEGYDKVSITDVYVAFKKNWKRNYNQDVAGLEGRVTNEDVETIKKRVAKEFKVIFSKELQDKGGYEVTDTAAKDVLVLRPAIINLVVNAPDLQRSGMSTSFVASAGEMTLYMELHDSLSGDKIAEVIDPQTAGNDGIAHVGNRVSNRAEFDRVLTKWADILRKALDEAKATASN